MTILRGSEARRGAQDQTVTPPILFQGESTVVDYFMGWRDADCRGAVFIDADKKTFCILKIAANYDYAQYSPGNIWCLYAIRHAIEKGYKICDFGRGTEKYNFSLGCKERFNRNVVVVRMGSVKKFLMRLRSQLHVRTRIKGLAEYSVNPTG